jgi:hypothetical protein
MSMLHICDWDEEADGYHLKIGFDFEQLEDTRRALDELSRTSD